MNALRVTFPLSLYDVDNDPDDHHSGDDVKHGDSDVETQTVGSAGG